MDLNNLFEKNHDSIIIKYVPADTLRQFHKETYPSFNVPIDIRDVIFNLRKAYGYDLRDVNIIAFFGTSKKNGEYSNWYPCDLDIDGTHFNCVEQYMMWSKASMFGDKEIANQILSSNNPREMKMLGRKVRNFDAARWNASSYDVVLKACKVKFSEQNPDLHEMIMNEEFPTFIETSPYDTLWGIGVDKSYAYIRDMRYWKGKNKLGRVLTEVWDYYNSEV